MIQVFDTSKSFTEVEMRQLGETNGHLVTLRAILNSKSSLDKKACFIKPPTVPSSHILSHRQSIMAINYTRINGVKAHLDRGVNIRDNTQVNQMTKTREEDRIRERVSMTGPYPIFVGNAELLRFTFPNVMLGSAAAGGDDKSHLIHRFKILKFRKPYLVSHHRMGQLLLTQQAFQLHLQRCIAGN